MKKGIKKGMRKGLEAGEKLGLQKGAAQGKVQITQQMFADGASIEKIQKWTGLSVAQIETLKGA